MLRRLKNNLFSFVYIDDIFEDEETLLHTNLTRTEILYIFSKANWTFSFNEISELLDFLYSEKKKIYLTQKVQECIQNYI